MLFYVFASVMCSFRAFLSREECQTLRIDLCRHADDLSTISSLFGDCEAYGVWPTKSFHPMLLWPSSVFHACFSRARCLTNVNKITTFIFDLVHDSFGSPFPDLVFWLFKYARDRADRLMGDLDV